MNGFNSSSNHGDFRFPVPLLPQNTANPGFSDQTESNNFNPSSNQGDFRFQAPFLPQNTANSDFVDQSERNNFNPSSIYTGFRIPPSPPQNTTSNFNPSPYYTPSNPTSTYNQFDPLPAHNAFEPPPTYNSFRFASASLIPNEMYEFGSSFVPTDFHFSTPFQTQAPTYPGLVGQNANHLQQASGLRSEQQHPQSYPYQRSQREAHDIDGCLQDQSRLWHQQYQGYTINEQFEVEQPYQRQVATQPPTNVSQHGQAPQQQQPEVIDLTGNDVQVPQAPVQETPQAHRSRPAKEHRTSPDWMESSASLALQTAMNRSLLPRNLAKMGQKEKLKEVEASDRRSRQNQMQSNFTLTGVGSKTKGKAEEKKKRAAEPKVSNERSKKRKLDDERFSQRKSTAAVKRTKASKRTVGAVFLEPLTAAKVQSVPSSPDPDLDVASVSASADEPASTSPELPAPPASAHLPPADPKDVIPVNDDADEDEEDLDPLTRPEDDDLNDDDGDEMVRLLTEGMNVEGLF